MWYIIEFLIYLTSFLIKLYSLVDKLYILNKSGAKIDKYIKDNLQNITYSLDNAQLKKNFFQRFYSISSIKSSISPKKIYITFIIYINIFMIKFAFSYNFFKTNFLYVNIFSKNIILSDLLGEYFIIFKILYYMFFSIFIINFIYKFVSYYINKKSIKKSPEIKNGLKILIGKNNEKEDVYIYENGLFQNILITGSIGSGKTSSAISMIVSQLLKNNIYGLIIDVKGNYLKNLKNLILKNNINKKIIEISLTSDFVYNPIDNLEKTSFEIANELKLVLTLLSDTKNSDSYWLDKVESFLRDFVTIIRAERKVVSFYEIHKMINDNDYILDKIKKLQQKMLENLFHDEELFNINAAILNIKQEYFNLDERTIGIIKSEITRITSIFASNKLLHDKFCKKGTKLDFFHNIYVLSMNIGENKQLLKIVATYLKLDFQKQILSRTSFYKPVFFVCDEYQEIVNVEDANFFSLSREFKCINVISIQSYSSILHSLNNEYSAKVIIQNLVNKIWFRSDDVYTVSEIIKQVGQQIKNIKTMNLTENGGKSRFSLIENNFINYNTSLAKGYSFAEKREYIFDENYFTTTLKTFEAVCFLSDGNNMHLYKKCTLKRME